MLQELKTSDEFNKKLGSGERFYIFKHSTRCNVSEGAHSKIQTFLNSTEVPVYLVYVVENRSLSNEIEDVTGVRHESPQLLVIENGNVVAHTSHFKIDEHYLNEHVTV